MTLSDEVWTARVRELEDAGATTSDAQAVADAELAKREADDITETQRVLAAMLTENTGMHMLDSGFGSGRHWQKNQGRDVRAFIDAPEVRVSEYGVSIELFHYLNERVQYEPEEDRLFAEFANEESRKGQSWLSCAAEYAAKYPTQFSCGSFLTYNTESDLLTQGFQCHPFTRGAHDYVLIAIHGGADIRGGYTQPRVFSLTCEDAGFGWDIGDLTITSSDDRKGESVCLDVRDGYLTDPDSGNRIQSSDPRSEWWNIWALREPKSGEPVWDAEAGRWRAPDGDGFIEFYPPDAY